jgi:hypothetical protein
MATLLCCYRRSFPVIADQTVRNLSAMLRGESPAPESCGDVRSRPSAVGGGKSGAMFRRFGFASQGRSDFRCMLRRFGFPLVRAAQSLCVGRRSTEVKPSVMLRVRCDEHQVSQFVVGRAAVNVVNECSGWDWPISVGPDQAVFHNIPPAVFRLNSSHDVAIMVDGGFAAPATERSRLSHSRRVTGKGGFGYPH